MPVLLPPMYAAASSAVLVAFCVGCVLGYAIYRVHSRSRHRPGVIAESIAAHRACRYCRTGQAVLLEEAIRLEAGEMVETRCFVCTRCGLPQWSVTRSPLVPHASR